MSDRLNAGNGHGLLPPEVIELQFPRMVEPPPPPPARRRPLLLALILFLLTVLSTLAVGAEFARSYAANQEPFSANANPFATMLVPFEHPQMLLLGAPFSFTLLAILFTHEMGHYVACKLYGIDVSFPYFLPAPTLFGTFGAVIRIRSPITTRRALFDVGLSGPVAGFAIAVPAMVWAVATSRVVPGVEINAPILFGNAPFTRLLIELFHPNVNPSWPRQPLSSPDLDRHSAQPARVRRAGVERLVSVGRPVARPEPALPPSARLRLLAAARSRAPRLGGRGAGHFHRHVHAVARSLTRG